MILPKNILFLIFCISSLVIYNCAFSEENINAQAKSIIYNLQKEIISTQGLKTEQNLGIFGNIINKMLNIPQSISLKDIKVLKWRKGINSFESYSIYNAAFYFTVVRSQNDKLKSILYINKLLAPLCFYTVRIVFNNGIYSSKTTVAMKFSILGNAIQKNLFFTFNKGSTEPIDRPAGVKVWGEVKAETIEMELTDVYNTAVSQQILSKKDDLGTFGDYLDKILDIKQAVADYNSSFLLKNQIITGIPAYNLIFDCYFINDFHCIMVIKGYSNNIYKIIKIERNSQNELNTYIIAFDFDGARFIKVFFDVSNLSNKTSISLIPLTKTEPVQQK